MAVRLLLLLAVLAVGLGAGHVWHPLLHALGLGVGLGLGSGVG